MKILRDDGTLLPKNSKIARENAVSVAVGIAQPFNAKSSPILHKKNINDGIRIPPNAAIAGRAIFLGLERWPSINSCFSSSPILKKNKEIKPSLIHNRIGLINE